MSMAEQMELDSVRFILRSIKLLLECGETQHALTLVDGYLNELEQPETQNTAKKTES